jgi:hypothetical protein
MSKNLSDIFPPTEIGGGGGGGIEEAPRDGRMYARQEQQNTGMGWTAFDPGNLDPGTEDDQVLLWHTADDKWSASNTVPAVQSGPTPPFNPVEGTLWMEVPNQGDATMWVYTKDSGGNGRWLQHPGGKDGAPGADGNIQDATTDGVIATWNSTDGRWTPDSSLTIDAGGNATFGGNVEATTYNVNTVGHFYKSADGRLGIRTRKDDATNTHYFNFGENGSTEAIFYATQQNLRLSTGSNKDTTGLVINSSGDATLSGTVSANNVKGSGGRSGLLFDSSVNVVPTLNGSPVSGQTNLGTSANRWGTVFGTVGRLGTVITDTGVAISTRDLIETLATLREATKDESTIEGLRDAIGNAVGGLIEKFEAMQSTATQEIDDE